MTAHASAGRLFLAAPLDEETRGALASHLETAVGRSGIPGRRVPASNWHFTLRFLGDSTVRARDRLVSALAEADLGAPFELAFEGLGAFPKPERARVLWIGAGKGAAELGRLAAVAESAAREAEYEPERRRFSAHLTLSRLRPEEDVRALIERVPPFKGVLTIDEVVLYRSHLGPSGARYERERRFQLEFGSV